MIVKLIVIALISYLLGDINPAIVIGKIKGVDIRKEGSGNPGMTNAIRVMGVGAGIAVFVVDVLKAFVAVKIGFAVAEDAGAMVALTITTVSPRCTQTEPLACSQYLPNSSVRGRPAKSMV